ncbi:MAG: hypothetical protein GX547_00510 [Phycisphaerae bacterium]|nr:hypothetical protein [Phycisphaerae bacterium]
MGGGPHNRSGRFSRRELVQCEEFTNTNSPYCTYAGEAFGALLNSYPTTFAGIQIHIGDAYTRLWGAARATFYNVPGTPTACFDGVIQEVGGAPGMSYIYQYNTRHFIPSDVEMLIGAYEVSPPPTPPTYEVQIMLSLEPSGTAKTVRVYAAQVLDYYPASPLYSRNCFRNAAAADDVALVPGGTVRITKTLQIDADSAAASRHMRLIVWAQAPNDSAPAEVYQAAIMNYPFEELCAMKISLPEGVPDFISPDAPTVLNVRIQNAAENLVPGSGVMYYRYDGGDFQSAPLFPLGGEYFTATLPAPGCGAEPEFYFAAQGDGGTTVVYPEGAPSEVETTIVTRVTTFIHDNFEDDLGWTVYDAPGLLFGSWERAVPGGFALPDGSPDQDYDGSGNCYVTDNRYGRDVDLGPTVLLSPIFDLLDTTDVYVRYARYIRCDDAETPPYPGRDFLDVELSGDGGVTWVQAEHVTGTGPKIGGWVYVQLRVADFVDLTSQFQIRFSVADIPNNSYTEAGVDDFWLFDLSCDGGPQYKPGDLNCDTLVDAFDIEPFVLALVSGPGFEGYYAAYPACNGMLADVNGDGSVNVFDIDPFVYLLTAEDGK